MKLDKKLDSVRSIREFKIVVSLKALRSWAFRRLLELLTDAPARQAKAPVAAVAHAAA